MRRKTTTVVGGAPTASRATRSCIDGLQMTVATLGRGGEGKSEGGRLGGVKKSEVVTERLSEMVTQCPSTERNFREKHQSFFSQGTNDARQVSIPLGNHGRSLQIY